MTHSRSTSRRLPGLAMIIVAGALVLSGCGSSTAGSATTNSAGGGGGAASTPNSTSATAAPSSASAVSTNGPSTSSAGGGNAAGSGFCKDAVLAEVAQRKSASSLAVDSPAALQKFEAQTLAKLKEFVAIAPSAIKGDLEVLVAADQQLYNSLAAAHFDMRNVNPAVLSKLDTPQFKKAVHAITAYLSTACGISPSTSS
jgi:hypothetical protein